MTAVARRRSLPAPLHVAVVLLAVISVTGAFVVAERGADFRLFHASAQLWMAGQNPYATGDRPNLNHPLLLLPILPFAHLPIETAIVAWLLVSVAVVAVSFAGVAGIIGRPSIELSASTLAVQGSFIALAMGQVTFLLMPILTAAWCWHRRGDAIRAGAALGVLTVLKPFYGVFAVYLLWRREWRGLMAYGAAAAIGMLAGIVLVGGVSAQTWLAGLGSVAWTRHLFNASVWGFAARLFDAAPPTDFSVAWTPVIVSATLKRGSIAVGLVGVALWMARLVKRDVDVAYATLTLGALLLSPLGWIYYLPVGAAPILAVICRPAVARRHWWVMALLCFPEPLLNGHDLGALGTVAVGLWPAAMVVSLLFLVAKRSEAVDASP